LTEKKKIGCLVSIDDNQIDQMLVKRIIERSGLVDEFVSFLSAERALEYFESEDSSPVDIVLLDINMPVMDGFEFLESAVSRVGEQFSQCVVIMLTTSLNPRDIERAKNTGVVKEYVHKPLTIDHLKKLIDSYIKM